MTRTERSSPYLGLDHPLITVRDRELALSQYRKLGFAPTPVTYHPWGTWTSLMVFQRDSLELIGIHDHSLVDEDAQGKDFAFGQHIASFLERDEGVSLIALHSKGLDADAKRLVASGVQITKRIDFKRAVTLPDGTDDEADVGLLILFDSDLPDASHFVCQQRRPHCIWHPGWQEHPNGAIGISAVAYLVDDGESALQKRLGGLYDAEVDADLSALSTENGRVILLDQKRANERYGTLPERSVLPACIGIDIAVPDLAHVAALLGANGVAQNRTAVSVDVSWQHTGGVNLRFVADT